MLVGLSGKRGAGKSTVAAELVNNYGFVHVAIGDDIKKFLVEQNPYVCFGGDVYGPLADLISDYGWDVAKADPAIRRLLQDTGTAATARWKRIFLKAAEAAMDSAPGDVVVSDVRAPWELAWLRRRGGVLVRIERWGHEVPDRHFSETDADEWSYDVVLHNQPGRTEPADLARWLLDELAYLGHVHS